MPQQIKQYQEYKGNSFMAEFLLNKNAKEKIKNKDIIYMETINAIV